MLYDAPIVIAGQFFKFTIVKLKGPNKTIKPLNHKDINRSWNSIFVCHGKSWTFCHDLLQTLFKGILEADYSYLFISAHPLGKSNNTE